MSTLHEDTLSEVTQPSNPVPSIRPGPREQALYDEIAKDRGLRYNKDKPQWSLLPWDAVAAVVGVLGYGAKKYAPRNWERGWSYSQTFDSLQRHLLAWYQTREDFDPESGKHHLAHVACNALCLLAFAVRNRDDLDDRPKYHSDAR